MTKKEIRQMNANRKRLIELTLRGQKFTDLRDSLRNLANEYGVPQGKTEFFIMGGMVIAERFAEAKIAEFKDRKLKDIIQH
jgi:hypothetical protein